jgi:glycosyltransferase involved in cell wall biosynthesis
MSSASVHIVLSDTGWILEGLARRLSDNIPDVRYDLETDTTADIQYYMTYATRTHRVSAVEIAYFAHVEQDPATRAKFFDVASQVDYAVCHSQPYEALIRERGIDRVVTIPPGVDLERFQPRVKIGVVGRTYHTGRKGEQIVAAVMDIPGIEWHFTGTGWPGPALELRDDEMPDFYRSMDYILVPSLYEGGPMSVVEALACGCKVIAPPVGWVPEFPHIEYKTGDVGDLRRVLNEVIEERMAMRRSVLNHGWNNWVEGHRKLFESLATSAATPRQTRAKTNARAFRTIERPGLIVHGTEKGTDKGGPSTRAPVTVSRLRRLGYDASLLHGTHYDQREHDLLHVFNVWHPATCRKAIEHARLSGRPVVLSPIYLDLSEKRLFDHDIPRIFARQFNPGMIDGEYARLRDAHAHRKARTDHPLPEPFEGFADEVRELVGMSDHLICLSEHERRNLRALGADVDRSTLVPNPVEPSLYAAATPELFQKTYGVKDYVLCVGRLESRKNQITLLHALKDLQIPLVLIGHAAKPEYEKLLRSVAGPNVVFAGRVSPNSPMLASAYAGARVFCLPSWSEGAPLVALEAAATGCNMVLSNRSSEKEYFGSRSIYCDPGDPNDVRAKVMCAYENPFTEQERQELAGWTAETYSWEAHVTKTAEVYERVAQARASTRSRAIARPRIYIDLTSSAHRDGPPSGIARVEERYALELHRAIPDRVSFVLWNSDRQVFVPVSYEQFVTGQHKKFCGGSAPDYLFDSRDFTPTGVVGFEPDAVLLVLGGAWIRNERYVNSLCATKRLKRLHLVAFIHDVIQAKFQHWFPENVGAEFQSNCRRLVESADHLVVNSRCTLEDLREFCDTQSLVTPPIDQVRFGDEIESATALDEEPQFDRMLPLLQGKPFILCVSALDIRKNHILLYNIWERMLAEYGPRTPHLIMVGSNGWNIDQFLSLVEKNAGIHHVFHILNGINDASLDWLYRNCLFTVYPSLYEGWGLPVAESLKHGKVCVAARAGAVPEIAPELTDLIDPLDFPRWYSSITGYAFNQHRLHMREEHVRRYRPVTWAESAKSLQLILGNLPGVRRPIPSISLGKPLKFDEASQRQDEGGQFKLGGWYGSEPKGTWTAGAVVTIQGRFRPAHTGGIVLELVGSAFTWETQPAQQAEVVINGKNVGRLHWSEILRSDVVVIGPEHAAAVREFGELTVQLVIANPMAPARVRPDNKDRRKLGLMMASMCLNPLASLDPDKWIQTAGTATGEGAVSGFRLCHGNGGHQAYKMPIVCRVTKSDGEADADTAYIGLKLYTKDTGDADVEYLFSGKSLGRATLPSGEVLTTFVPVPVQLLNQGGVFEIAGTNISTSKLDVVECGVFSLPGISAYPAIGLGAVVDYRRRPTLEAGAVADGFKSEWDLRHHDSPTRSDPLRTLLSGWHAPEPDGVWTAGHRAYIGLRMRTEASSNFVLAFRVRPYKARYVDVRANKGPWHRWNLSTSSELQTRYMPLSASDLTDGGLVIEFDIRDSTVPSEVDGAADSRSLGLFVQSFTLLPLTALTESLEGLTPDTEVNLSEESLGLFQLRNAAAIIHNAPHQSPVMLLSGWSYPETSGIWTDGDAAFLLLRIPRSDPSSRIPRALTFEVRPYAADSASVRINGGNWHMWELAGSVPQRRVLMIDDACQDEVLLIEIRPMPLATPTSRGESDDDRRLGLLLSLVCYAGAGETVQAAEGVAPAPDENIATRLLTGTS